MKEWEKKGRGKKRKGEKKGRESRERIIRLTRTEARSFCFQSGWNFYHPILNPRSPHSIKDVIELFFSLFFLNTKLKYTWLTILCEFLLFLLSTKSLILCYGCHLALLTAPSNSRLRFSRVLCKTSLLCVFVCLHS